MDQWERLIFPSFLMVGHSKLFSINFFKSMRTCESHSWMCPWTQLDWRQVDCGKVKHWATELQKSGCENIHNCVRTKQQMAMLTFTAAFWSTINMYKQTDKLRHQWRDEQQGKEWILWISDVEPSTEELLPLHIPPGHWQYVLFVTPSSSPLFNSITTLVLIFS